MNLFRFAVFLNAEGFVLIGYSKHIIDNKNVIFLSGKREKLREMRIYYNIETDEENTKMYKYNQPPQACVYIMYI